MRMPEWAGWPSEPSTPPLTLGDGKKKTKKENSHHSHLHRCGRKVRRRGRGTFQLGSTRACKRKSTQMQKNLQTCKGKGKGLGGMVGCS